MRISPIAIVLFGAFLFGCSHAQSSLPQPRENINGNQQRPNVSPDSPPKHYVMLYSFQGGADGKNPEGGLVRDGSGNLYGTTEGGGSGTRCDGQACGTVFKVDPSGNLTTLHRFNQADGARPGAKLILDAAGNIYGTTIRGGTSLDGVAFELQPNGVEIILHSFNERLDGEYPKTDLIRDAAGNLFGTASGGGALGLGTVFKLDPTGNETVLHTFTGEDGGDGAEPLAGLIRDAAGNLYGTTNHGGSARMGIIFKVDPSGSETVLHNFSGADGASAHGGLVRDSAGNLFGDTFDGGAANDGVVFRLDSSGNETVLKSFKYPHGGPQGDLVRSASGDLYGTTKAGGPSNAGEVYELDPTGKLTVLHVFNGADGAYPDGGLIRDAAGDLYGIASGGGSSGSGVVFELTH